VSMASTLYWILGQATHRIQTWMLS